MKGHRVGALALMVQASAAFAQPLPVERAPIERKAHDESCRKAIAAEIAGLDLTFTRGTADLDARSRGSIGALAAHLRDCPTMRLRITGDLDDDCDADVASRLSHSRAAAAVAELVRRGIRADRLEAKGSDPDPARRGTACGSAGPTNSPTGVPTGSPRIDPTVPPVPAPIPPSPAPWGTWWWALPLAFLAGLVLGWLLGRRGDRPDPARAETDFPARPISPLMLTPIGVPAAVGPPDDLMQIKGIGPQLKAMLAGLGITRFDQVARWSDAETQIVDEHLTGYHGRITRESWVEQARLLDANAFAEYTHRFGKMQIDDT